MNCHFCQLLVMLLYFTFTFALCLVAYSSASFYRFLVVIFCDVAIYWRLFRLRVAFVGFVFFPLHFFVICRFCSHDGSLFGFNLSLRVIWPCGLHSAQVPFSYRQAFLHFFWTVFVGSHVGWSPFLSVSVRALILVFGSHSDHCPFTYLHCSLDFVPRSLRIRTSWSSSSQISPSARTRRTKLATAKLTNSNHFIFINISVGVLPKDH